MNTWRIGSLLCLALVAGRPGFAQTPVPLGPFVDGAIVAERDPTDLFDGSQAGTAGRLAIGGHLSERNSLRFELDVPRWRVVDTTSSSPVFCARDAGCVGGEGLVPARTTTHSAVRTVSYSVLYARHLPAMGRVQVAVLAGASLEGRARQSAESFDELDRSGHVVQHRAYSDDRGQSGPAAVLGVDAEIGLTPHLAVTPQFRFHTFPYPAVSIVRSGIALRWHF